LENTQLVRLYSFTEEPGCPEYDATLSWSPDGTQFVYFRGIVATGSFTVLRADGSEELFLGEFYKTYAFWSPHGRYLIVKTFTGSHTAPTSGYTAYDASSWQTVCRVASCQHCNYPESLIGDLGGRCELLVGDNHTLVLRGYWGQSQVGIMLCDLQGACIGYPDEQDAINNWSYLHQTQSVRHLANIENYWLQIVDIETGVETTYVVPGYRITAVAWSPDRDR
jgi:hypothetical protein